jgi:hypothetical protein
MCRTPYHNPKSKVAIVFKNHNIQPVTATAGELTFNAVPDAVTVNRNGIRETYYLNSISHINIEKPN